MGLVHFWSRSLVQHKVGPERWAETCGVKDGGSFVISVFVIRFLRWFFNIFLRGVRWDVFLVNVTICFSSAGWFGILPV